MATSAQPYILFPGEADTMIKSLEEIEYEQYGQEKWYKYHGYLMKINMQAVSSAQTRSDEFVKEYLICYQKLPVLVKDLILLELWKEKVFKQLLFDQIEPSSAFPVYALLYHELILANLLETVTFYADATESLGETAVDLSDWCYRSLCYLVSNFPTEESKKEFFRLKDKIPSESNLEDLERQNRIIAFDKGMKAISLVRHLIDHSLSKNSVLPLGVARRLLQSNDVVLVLCQLIEQAPWMVETNDQECGEIRRFVWQESGDWFLQEKLKSPLGKTEGQIWICLYQVLLANHSDLHYDCSMGHRRAALLRLRCHLTEGKLDILPVLVDLRRFLEQLSLGDSTAGAGNSSGKVDLCLVELIPEIHESVCKKYTKKWKQLCSDFRKFTESERGRKAAQRAATQWSEMFSEEHLEKLFSQIEDNSPGSSGNPYGEAPRCVVCGEKAMKRCSRCRQEWYCRRECQVKHWPKHKNACDLVNNAFVDKME
ncbi:hypothetical protein EG68_03344 [Paragonimus skrjabini miyazakii]|uniref:Zinc finger MYND domain-containing protein 10 n=1 Tax=Paragonimus skrjabini miyazakii TaxID=59628 RepID=A0A8S9Z0N5_9TREM|nr:hypothetical protein EG68_03344 [Paragonimus skrjabini miyazakii]